MRELFRLDCEGEARSQVGLAEELIAIHRVRHSWRERLGWVHEVLADDGRALELQDLVDLAVYLRFLATGQVACAEDGHHYRPSHHAETSRAIFTRLRAIASTENALVLRKIYPQLPAFAPQFARKEPLTRIREIAHRNDIPQSLKREIKHSLQNKLHRCAGPEDLDTSAALLQRILAEEVRYSKDFVAEFKLFHAELKEFFAARSLDEQLAALSAHGGLQPLGDLARNVIASKSEGSDSVVCLRAMTHLREALATELSDAAADEPWRQQCQLADIALEDHAFVGASMIQNALRPNSGEFWQIELEVLPLLVRNLELNGVAPLECAAIAADARHWAQCFDPTERDELLRIHALLQRCRRLAGHQADTVLALFARRVAVLGDALGVSSAAIETFCEADLRANLLFQLTRWVEAVDGCIRSAIGLSPWVPVVQGSVNGELISIEHLNDLVFASLPESCIVLARQAQGDETLPAALTGLVVAHEVPQLSHLAVRARQGQVVFAACESPDEIRRLHALAGKQVLLEVSEDAVSCDVAISCDVIATQDDPRVFIPSPKYSTLAVKAVVKRHALSLDEAPIMSLREAPLTAMGAKAAGLARVAATSSSAFRLPETLIVPLGTLEAQLLRHREVWTRYERLLGDVDSAQPKDIPALCAELRRLIDRVEVPPEIVDQTLTRFAPDTALIVRSSANCEDLAHLSGAGLYDSIANVSPAQVADAVRHVWTSLWTDRAALARRADGISAHDAQMGVMVQRMVIPEWSFFMHTAHPLSGDSTQAYVELAVGLGNTLASTSPGTPFRWRCDKTQRTLTVTAFPSLSDGLFPRASGGLERRVLRYSEQALCEQVLCRTSGRRQELGATLSTIACEVEAALGGAQDVEGVLAESGIYLVQVRPQQGLTARIRLDPPACSIQVPMSSGSEEPLKPAPSIALAPLERTGKRPIAKRPITVLVLFEKRIQGDDALLELAARRCAEAELGLELHPTTPAQLDELLRFRPSSTAPVMVHLPRQTNLLHPAHRDEVLQFAAHAAGRVSGFVVHDRPELVESPEAYRSALVALSRQLERVSGKPFVFIEYAVGVPPERFVEFLQGIASVERVSACIDSGHIGIRQLCHAFSAEHPTIDPCTLTPYDERLPELLPALERARASCLAVLLTTVRELTRLEKPTHFHLHDGHPLWTLSAVSVRDHVSFFESIAIPFDFEGRRTLELMYGPGGLRQIVQTALEQSEPDRLSMTLEIHPVYGHAPLGDAAQLFHHWRDTRHAEQMNFWLMVLLANAKALRASERRY